MSAIDVDAYGAASHRNQRDNLVPVLQSGAVDELIPIADDATAVVAWTREPLLLLGTAAPLGIDGFDATVTLDPGGADTTLATVHFEPFTDAGSFLPVWPTGGVLTASPFTVGVSLRRQPRDHGASNVAASKVAGMVELRLVEGVLGRLLYLCGAEKQRIRRAARELSSSRVLDLARSASLDQHGRDLGVARFDDVLAFSPGPPAQIHTAPRPEPDGREPDKDYRWRLKATRPVRMANRASVLEALNGPGEPTDPPLGALAELGSSAPASRLVVDDRPADFAVAVHLISGGDDAARTSFLASVRRDRLVRPVVSAAATADYDGRFLTAFERTGLDELGASLRDGFTFDGDAAGDPALAIALARALARVAGCRAALGVAAKWSITRVQLDDGGNRYELGLGADLAVLAAGEVEQLAHAVVDANRAPADDPEIEALLVAMAASAPDPADDELRWLLEPCGLSTVHRADADTLFVSHVPMQGLVVQAPHSAQLDGWSHLVAGSFELGWGQQLLRYDSVAGKAELVRLDRKGGEETLGQFGGWRNTWSVLTPFSDRHTGASRTGDGVLLYDRHAGEVAARRFVDGTVVELAAAAGWRTTWRLLACGSFSNRPEAVADVARYDPTTGDLEVVSLLADGTEKPVDRLVGQRSSWSAMAVVRLGDVATDSLVLYDRTSGSVEVYRVGGAGRLELVHSRSRWRPGFSHLVAAPALLPTGVPMLVGYDREAGTADLLAVAPDGRLLEVATMPAGRRMWSQVVTGRLLGGRTSNVAFYDRALGYLVSLGGRLESEGVPEKLLQAGGGTDSSARSGWELLELETVHAFAGTPAVDVEGRVLGAGDSPSHVLLTEGLSRAAATWADRGGQPWTVELAAGDQQGVWQAVADPAAAAAVFAQADLPVATPAQQVATPLTALPVELLATLRLDPALSASIIGGGSVDELRGLVGVLAGAGFDAALGLVTGNEVAVVVGMIGLPGAGVNLTDRRSTGFRWYTVPIGDLPGVAKPIGSRTTFHAVAPGVTAVVAVAHLRGDRPDPYELRVDLPQGTLDLDQYELVMNLLDEWHPAGVEVNTFRLRRQRVDLDGDDVADPLPPTLARTFRRYRRRANATTDAPTTGPGSIAP